MERQGSDMQRFDVIVVGAGFGGMHMLWKLRQLNMSAIVFERGSDVGGTWYWNRYPGARCDVPSMDYSVPWDPEMDQEWNWSERFSTQPEILDYATKLADRHDLRRDIRFNTAVTKVTWEEGRRLWTVETDSGDVVEAPFFVSAAGTLSEPNLPDIPGIDDFKGEVYHTGRWPKEGVELAGRRVAVLGTGSTGIQACTAMAKQAAHLYVLQRTAQFSLPCHTPPLTDEFRNERKARYPESRDLQRASYSGQAIDLPLPYAMKAFDHPRETRYANYETCWNAGWAALVGVYGDVSTNAEVNREVADFVRAKIRGIVNDPATAEKLCPRESAYIGTRRIIIDTGYYQIFNQPNVTLIDIAADPILEITPDGVRTRDHHYPIDVLVIATGYDAVTGPLVAMNITGAGGRTLKEEWNDGPHSYLGLMVAGFPNLFTITGPGSPGVRANVIFSIDQHVNWIADCLVHMAQTGATRIDTTPEAEAEWQAHAMDTLAGGLLLKDAKNWYLGTNIPGKPRAPLVYHGGLGFYGQKLKAITADGYRGFTFAYEKEAAAA